MNLFKFTWTFEVNGQEVCVETNENSLRSALIELARATGYQGADETIYRKIKERSDLRKIFLVKSPEKEFGNAKTHESFYNKDIYELLAEESKFLEKNRRDQKKEKIRALSRK